MSERPSDRDLAIAMDAVRRKGATIDLLPTDCYLAAETAAFDVVVDGMGLIGRWAQLDGTNGCVTWTDGSTFETGGCEGDPLKIIAAVRNSIPVSTRSEQPTGRGRRWQRP